MAELIPCPFCGGDGSMSIVISAKILYGSCWVCGARGPVVTYKDYPTDEDIIAASDGWNGRYDNG